jgi:hypothetical protein
MASPGADPLHRPSGSGREGNAEAVADKAEQLTERVKDKATDLKRQAKDTVQKAGQRARSAADEQKNMAAEQVGGVAHALRVASDDLEGRGHAQVAEYSRQVAEGLDSLAQSLSRRSVDDLVAGVEGFARERPVAFMGGAMVAGFALARFMKSSAARRSGEAATRDAAAGRAAPGTHGAAGGETSAAEGYGRPEEGAL